MGKCVNHPDRETSYHCSKHARYLCEECLECRDPKLYCKFRTSCPIWFLRKEANYGTCGPEDADEQESDEFRKSSCR